MADRVVLHCDCNSFYASVELLHRPELHNLPVAVSGNVDDRHGIILAKNEAAKKFGVKTAETVWQAKRKCPDIILLPPNRVEYARYSKILNKLYEKYTDKVEPFGIDESWLDVTGSWMLFAATPRQMADRLREDVHKSTGLTISVGLSFNKVFAKLGSDYKKPDATTEITRENVQSLLWPLPVTDLLFVGRRADEQLAELGVRTIGQLAMADEGLLKQLLGKLGPQLWRYANGLDDSPVLRAGESEPVKSVGNGLTFRRNLVGRTDVRTAVGALADEVATRLRRQGLFAASLQVLIKNPELKSITRQGPLPYATNLERDLTACAMDLIGKNWDYAKPIRMLTITAQSLTDLPFATQTSLFKGEAAGPSERQKRLESSVDEIRRRYGRGAVQKANVLRNDIGLHGSDESEEEK